MEGFPAKLLETLPAAQQVTVLTGAGISAESGVPTFRDAQTGLWARYRAEDLATYHLSGSAGIVLPALIKAAWG